MTTIAPPPTPHWLPEHRSMANDCLCPGCYWIATENSELCLRCTLEGCDHENNRHA